MNDQAIQALYEALKVSPDNVPLRTHLAETLMMLGRYAEAEQEYRQALSRAPEDTSLKIGLARARIRTARKLSSCVATASDDSKLVAFCGWRR